MKRFSTTSTLVGLVAGTLALGTSAMWHSAAAQTPPAPGAPPASPPPGASPSDMLQTLKAFFGPIRTIDKVAEHLYVIRGGGGNTAVWVWSKGVLLVDPKIPTSGEGIMTLVRTVTDLPVTHIIDTHAHLDHSGANAEFGPGVQIISQENTRANLLKSNLFKDDASKPGLPTRTFKTQLKLFSGRDEVDLRYFGRAHTDGDTFVIFPSVGVMHSGDVFSRKELPKIDFQNGGSGVTLPETVARAVAGIKHVQRVIGGHSETVMTWQDFTAYANLTRQWLAFERAQQAAGATPQQTLDSFQPPAEFADYTKGLGGFGGVGAVKGTFEEIAH